MALALRLLLDTPKGSHVDTSMRMYFERGATNRAFPQSFREQQRVCLTHNNGYEFYTPPHARLDPS